MDTCSRSKNRGNNPYDFQQYGGRTAGLFSWSHIETMAGTLLPSGRVQRTRRTSLLWVSIADDVTPDTRSSGTMTPMFIASPVDPCFDPEAPGQAQDHRTESRPLWVSQIVNDIQAKVYVSEKDVELVYGSQPHHPIGSRPACEVHVSLRDGQLRFVLQEREVPWLIAALQAADGFITQSEKSLPVTYRDDTSF